MPADERNDIRKMMRRRRRDLDPGVARAAAARLCTRIIASDTYRESRRLAAYIANDGEIDLAPLIKHAWQTGRGVFLPVVRECGLLEFCAYTPETLLSSNRYGIPEPRQDQSIAAGELDIVLVPLVAFDSSLNRLGMGGGYYDKTFASRNTDHENHPLLAGVAYEFQKVPSIMPQEWDVPVSRVYTEMRCY